MSDPSVPPPPPAPPDAPPAKQGLSTGAKIAIGCLVVLLLIAGGCFVVTAFVGKKVVDFARDAEKDPEAAAVKATELMMRMNPEVEVVSSDPEAGRITLREKRTGKVVTFNAEDLKSGKFSFESEGETTSVDFDGGSGEEPGALRVTSGERRMTFGADAGDIPEWVPRYPGARSDSLSTVEAGEETSGTFTIHTADEPAAVLDYFERTLEAAGFEVEKSTMRTVSAEGGNITATRGGRSVNVTHAAQEGETQGLVAYTEKR